jgi:hypothetical protein
VPPLLAEVTCASRAECPAGYVCGGAAPRSLTCQPPRFEWVDDASFNAAFNGTWPAFLSPQLKRFFEDYR